MIFRFVSISLKNCSEICIFSGIRQNHHFLYFCVQMKINMSTRGGNDIKIVNIVASIVEIENDKQDLLS